jgi:two-component system, cell cycle sensor histidine kinase and response regulator CckA
MARLRAFPTSAVTLPLPAPRITPAESGQHVSSVLIVDDDPAICMAYFEILSARGYDVALAGSRLDALAQIERLDGIVDVLIIDITLPDADGASLAREIIQQIGLRPALYVSGWTEEFWDLTDAPGRWLVMQKPVPVPRLIAAVDWLAGKRPRPPV